MDYCATFSPIAQELLRDRLGYQKAIEFAREGNEKESKRQLTDFLMCLFDLFSNGQFFYLALLI